MEEEGGGGGGGEAAVPNPTSKRIALVTGANKGIGLEICQQLCAAGGILVVLTARDRKRGLAAAEKLRAAAAGAPDLLFHQLDVLDSSSVASLARFIQTQFGKLDILVNNAGINGTELASSRVVQVGGINRMSHTLVETYDLAEKCIMTNYFGMRKVTEAMLPLLLLSKSPRVVNLTSVWGKLKCIPGEHIKEEIRDINSLTEDRLDELARSYLNDFRREKLEENGWPSSRSAYIVSKVAIGAYTRLLARRYPELCVNCVHPGYVKTAMTWNHGVLPVKVGARGPVMLALLPDGAPSGLFYDLTEVSSFD